jgi:two-component system LytT family sensor kinase
MMVRRARVRLVVVAVVCGVWLLLAIVLGSQAALGLSMQGNPVDLLGQIRSSLVDSLPWIPPTLIAIAMATRFPLTASTWIRRLPLHLLAVPVVAWIANVGVVLGYWTLSGSFNGWTVLASQAAFWATIRIHLGLLVYGVSVGLTQGWAYVRDTRARELRFARLETQLTRARLQALNEQIRPHFLFNTLHAIGQMWRSGRGRAAEEMLDRLGSLFQRVRSSTDRPGIALAEELSMVEDYLAIERARFSDRLHVGVSATADARTCVVPPLLLQPLVENAIQHGVSVSAEAGNVSVRATVEGERLVIEVCDDGPGMGVAGSSGGSGTGLANTRERLRHAFGEDHAFEIVSPNGPGTTVRLELPARHDPDGANWSDW